jgi:hypothetical protein
MDMKTETNVLDGMLSKKQVVSTKMALKMEIRCESYVLLRK